MRLLAPVLYICLALLQTAPLGRHLATHIPLGNYPASTTARFNLWTLWWNSDRLAHGYRGYWQAPIFHPDPYSFAYSEPQWLTGAAAGCFYWLGATPVVAYNLVLLAALALNGWCGFYLLRRLPIRFWPAVCGGALIQLLPLTADQLGVIQSTVLFPVLMVLASLVQLGRTGRLWWALACALWMAACHHTSANTALLFGPLALLGLGVLAARVLLRPRVALVLPAAALLYGLLIAPMALVQMEVLQRFEHHRPEAWIRATSAIPQVYGSMPVTNLLRRRPPDRVGYCLYPGTGIVLLAGVGVWYGMRRRRFRRLTSYLLVAAAACLLLSFGPLAREMWLGALLSKPYELLRDYYPGFRHARNLWRFGGMLQIFLGVLAGLGLAHCFGQRIRARRTLLGALVTLAALVELVCVPIPLLDPGPDTSRLAWVRWLRAAPVATTIVHLPMATGSEPERYETTTYWMNCQMVHGRRMANGYSGYVPEHTSWLSQVMARFPDAESMTALRRRGISHLLVGPEWMASRRDEELERWKSEVLLELATPEMRIYRIAGVVPRDRLE